MPVTPEAEPTCDVSSISKHMPSTEGRIDDMRDRWAANEPLFCDGDPGGRDLLDSPGYGSKLENGIKNHGHNRRHVESAGY